MTENAYKIIESYHDEFRKGVITEAKAKSEVLRVIKNIRFEDNNYFWINDMQPAMIMHPVNTALDGQDLSDYKDPNGKRLFVEFVEVCRHSGEGTVDYEWPKPGFTRPQPKLSYVKLFKPWGWIVGTGVYIDDVNAIVGKLQMQVIGIVGLSLLIAFLISFVLIKKLSGSINKVVAMLKDIAQGEGDLTKTIDVDSQDEVGELAKWFNVFIEKLHDIITQIANTTIQAAAAAQQAAEGRQVLRRADEQDVPDAGQHQRAERVVHHRFVINGQQLLADCHGQRVEARAPAPRQDDSFHFFPLSP